MYKRSTLMILSWAVSVTLMCSIMIVPSFAQTQGQVTITTYYPSPNGVYDRLQSNRFSIGDTNDDGELSENDLPNRDGDLRLTPQSGDPETWPSGELGQVSYSELNGDLYHFDGSAWLSAGAKAGGEVPSGAVMFFNLAQCPEGWSAFTSAEGRYLVGLNPGGDLGATVGTALTNIENRPVGEHNHTTGWGGAGCGLYCGPNACCMSPGSYTTGMTGVEGTNAPYIQLTVCTKD